MNRISQRRRKNRVEQNKAGYNRIQQKRTEQNRINQDRTELKRIEEQIRKESKTAEKN